MVIITALIAGLIIGMGTAAALELRAGVIVEPWQVQHVTTLPVLASIPLRGSSKGDGS